MIEVGAVAAIVGILASLAVPSMVGTVNKNKVQATANRVKAVFQEAQRAAIRNSSTCTVTTSSTAITGSGCITDPITTKDTSDQSIALSTNVTPMPTSFKFSYKGNPDFTGITLSGAEGLMFIVSSTQTSERRCILITSGIGIMRSGIYDGTNCNASFY